MAKLADAVDSKSTGLNTRVGSIPSFGIYLFSFVNEYFWGRLFSLAHYRLTGRLIFSQHLGVFDMFWITVDHQNC